ncbi:DUF4870 domain-containing protein [Bacillus sp. 31A1R]|uniref:DUF4870 domain-containing protein n=1 Tax=Robertmurraya mangrovi TaxID=3098077 RepID=A0ABU5J3W7_9BACI|nr:DUF4870 domain-containing protein [Bacillus sp. 31A1R]MDZ5474120.1 DUF4870 domain-containing protein [Bacillus sp. 31A1R]
METNKILSALSYFSIFFAGIVFPLIVLLVSEDKRVKEHAKSALLSHFIPLIPVPFLIFAGVTGAIQGTTEMPIFLAVGVVVTIILSLVVTIWNIVKGVKVLSKESI